MNKLIVGIVVVVVIGIAVVGVMRSSTPSQTIKIGIITDLTGPAAYWGDSTRVGAELALEDLRKKGYKVELVYEDYQLDPAKAASAAQKVTTIDQVDAVYVELNPGAIAAAPIVNSANIPMIYNAAIVSPLSVSENFFKSYLDYEVGCEAIARKFKEEGLEHMGMLKLNLEAGELCETGIRKVYRDVIVESYNLGETDFRTQMLKLQSADVNALINVGFPGDISNTLQVMKSHGYSMKFGTVDDSLTPEIKEKFGGELTGAWTFGFKNEDAAFIARADAKSTAQLATYFGAAEAYTHISQLVESLEKCGKETTCTVESLAASKPDANSGFLRFENGIAQLEMSIKEY